MKNSRYDVSVAEYISSLLAKTADGKLTVTRYPDNGEEPYDVTFSMDWDAEKAREVALQFETLRAHLERLGLMHQALEDEEKAKKLLTQEEFAVWQTYVAPFEGFEADPEEIFDLQMKEEFEELTQEEEQLLDRYYDWYEQQCLQRLPCNRRSSVYLVNRAKRYERLISLHAPKLVVDNEAYCLALEMVLYYCVAAQ